MREVRRRNGGMKTKKLPNNKLRFLIYQTNNTHHSVRVKNDKTIPIPTSIAANSLFSLYSVATIAAVIIGGIADSKMVTSKINPLCCVIKK